jgi:rod shape determining protein RodA
MAKAHFRLVPYRLLPGVDWSLIVITIALAVCGVVTLWGATSKGNGPGPLEGYAKSQLIWFGIGLVLMVGLTVFDYRWLKRVNWVFYGIILVLLAGLLAKGETIKGARSWYDLRFFKLQPSEPGKVIIVLALAQYLAPRVVKFRGIRHVFKPMAIVCAPMLLILKQPDFGTAVVLIPTTAAMFWVAGLRKWIFIMLFVVGVGGGLVGYPHLLPHQKARIQTFLNPEADPRGKGYNIIQAQTALGSGEMLGKGWGRGTQTNFHFLPEYHTDFIFPTVGEQFGFVGCSIVLLLQLMLIARMIHLAHVTQDIYGVLIITGLTAMLVTHVILNVGMTVGLLPVTGLPLPFFSYGGSFVLTCMASVGLALGIGTRRGL